MHSPRWQKALADLWGNKARTALVVLSIAVGVFAIGMVSGSSVIISRELRAQYALTRPASATIYTVDAFDDDLVNVVRRMRGVEEAEGRRLLTVRYLAGPDRWRSLQLIALPDYDEIRIHKVNPVAGAWPPPEHAVVVERSSLQALQVHLGQSLLIETPEGKRRQVRIAGVAHDLSQITTFFSGTAYGYVTFDTLEWLGEPRDFNLLHIVASHAEDKAAVTRVAEQVRDKIEKSGRSAMVTQIPDPGEHWAEDVLRAMLLILGVLGMLSLLLSALLVINTISSLLTQQIRQIGIMKAVGGRAGQIVGMYLAVVVAFGLLALVVAIPLGILGARGMAGFNASMLNYDLHRLELPPRVLAQQVIAGLLVPLLAAVYPVVAGTRITVREAITAYGLSGGGFGEGAIDRLVGRVRGLSRPLLLSLRNTVRRKGRLLLTLTTLTLAGAIFIGVVSVRSSLLATLDDSLAYWNYDVEVEFDRSYRIAELDRQARRIPGVVAAESWGFRSAVRLRPDGTESDTIMLVSLPAATQMLRPIVLQGRWLHPDDENALVVNTDVIRNEPDVRVGGTMTLKVDGRESEWRIVGVVRGVFAPAMAYGNYPYLSRVTRTAGRGERIQVVTERHDAAFTSRVERSLDAHFRNLGLRLTSTQTIPELRAQITAQFNVLIVFLLIMAALLAVVGGLGLMGTMSINVLERTREIGVLRAIGASDGAVLRIVLAEGILIGLFSWAAGTVLALPFGKGLSTALGVTMLFTPLTYRYSFGGAVLWLALIVALAALASFLPAWNASRITVRDVLAYE